MFELRFVIQAKNTAKRFVILSLVEEVLQNEFSGQIVDVSRWDFMAHPIDDEFLVSVNYHAKDPHQIRIFIATTLRLRVVSLTNPVTKKDYPIKHQRPHKQTKSRQSP